MVVKNIRTFFSTITLNIEGKSISLRMTHYIEQTRVCRQLVLLNLLIRNE